MEKNKKEINQTSKSLALQLLRFVFTDKKCFHPLKKKWFLHQEFTSLVSSFPVCIIFRQDRRHLVNIIIRVVPNLVLDVCSAGEMDNIHPLLHSVFLTAVLNSYKAFSLK